MRMFEGKFTADQEDNVLIEWILAMRVAKVKGAKIYPLLIGNLIADDDNNNGSLGYLRKRESFFTSNLLGRLSTVIPTKCIEIANKVMQDYQFPSSTIPEQSVKDIVCELTKYQAYDFCNVGCKEVVEDYTDKVMEVLRKKISEDEKANNIPRQKVSVEKSAEDLVEEDKVKYEVKTGESSREKLANQNYDELVNWFQSDGGFSLPTAESYAKILIDKDIATIAKLKRKLKKNENILVRLGIKPEDAEDLLDILI